MVQENSDGPSSGSVWFGFSALKPNQTIYLSLNQFGLDKPKPIKPKQSRFRFLAQATS